LFTVNAHFNIKYPSLRYIINNTSLKKIGFLSIYG